ncbi:MAG: phosphatase PAP2 family protein [Pseudomonadota bacterium]
MAVWSMPLLCLGAALLFLAVPGIDLAASSLFHDPAHGFALGNTAWARLFYVGSPILVRIWIVLLIALALLSLRPRFGKMRRHALFLLAVILIGPGLGVMILKDHWGRARPLQIAEFGGDRQFTPAWVIADQCDDNCSFVSGHASGAFSLMALAWVFKRQRRLWLLAGVLWGGHMGLIRMMQGGHFLSDVIFAGFVVYFTADWLARWVFYRPAPPP